MKLQIIKFIYWKANLIIYYFSFKSSYLQINKLAIIKYTK